MVKKDLNISLATKTLKKLDLICVYVYFPQKWEYIGETLMKLNISFLIKDDELLEKYNEIWEDLRNSIQKEFESKPV